MHSIYSMRPVTLQVSEIPDATCDNFITIFKPKTVVVLLISRLLFYIA